MENCSESVSKEVVQTVSSVCQCLCLDISSTREVKGREDPTGSQNKKSEHRPYESLQWRDADGSQEG